MNRPDRLRRGLVIASLAMGWGLLHAQQVPASVKLIVGYAAGGPVDQAAHQIAPVLSYYNVLVINKDLPFKSLNELVDYARANPGKVSYGSAGVQAFANALKDTDMKNKLEAAGFEPWLGAPEAVDARAKKERAMWATVTKDIKVE